MAEVERLIEIYQQLEDAGLMVIAGKKDSAELMVSHDVVPVVRCKDCKYRGNDTYCPMCFDEWYEIDEGGGFYDSDFITHDRTIDEGFCDRGERRTDDDC